MPSIRKQKVQKVQKRSKQQKRRPGYKLQLEEERQQLEEERLQLDEERQRLEEERQKLEADNNDELDSLDNKGFEKKGGCGGFKKHINNRPKQPVQLLLNPALTENDEQIDEIELNKEDLPTFSVDDTSKKNMRPYPRSAAEKEEMREIINQGLSSGEFEVSPVGPNGAQTIVKAQNGGRKSKQQRPVSLRTAVKLLKKYYIKRN
jgi:hypothetical protein